MFQRALRTMNYSSTTDDTDEHGFNPTSAFGSRPSTINYPSAIARRAKADQPSTCFQPRMTRMNTDANELTRISQINANALMHADFLWGAHAPRVQCSAPSRNTRELARRNAFDPSPTSLTSDF